MSKSEIILALLSLVPLAMIVVGGLVDRADYARDPVHYTQAGEADVRLR